MIVTLNRQWPACKILIFSLRPAWPGPLSPPACSVGSTACRTTPPTATTAHRRSPATPAPHRPATTAASCIKQGIEKIIVLFYILKSVFNFLKYGKGHSSKQINLFYHIIPLNNMTLQLIASAVMLTAPCTWSVAAASGSHASRRWAARRT